MFFLKCLKSKLEHVIAKIYCIKYFLSDNITPESSLDYPIKSAPESLRTFVPLVELNLKISQFSQ